MNTIIQTPTNRLHESLEFYQRLGFQVVSETSPTLVYEGKTVIQINPDRYARAGVRLFRPSWEEAVRTLELHTAVTKTPDGYLLSDPSGVWIYLVEGNSPHPSPAAEASFSLLGNCAGLSLESTDIHRAREIWGAVGFDNCTGDIEQGWIACQNEEEFTVSLMKPNACPHLFFNPSLTYFNGKSNIEIISKIRELNIPITEEISHFNKEGLVDNIIVRDPGGYGFFLFSD